MESKDGLRRSFDELIAEAQTAPVEGWDFSWFDGRGTEQRPSWGYQRLLRTRLATARAALDLYTGGGEVLAGAGPFPPVMVATESWPPNINVATDRLHPLGAVVVATTEGQPLPFGDGAFDLVTSRHPSTLPWNQIARVLRPGGSYFAQHVGAPYNRSLIEHFKGPQPEHQELIRGQIDHMAITMELAANGLEVTDLRYENIRLRFNDVGAIVYYLRKLPWIIPEFDVQEQYNRLLELHDQIQEKGSFDIENARVLIDARKLESI